MIEKFDNDFDANRFIQRYQGTFGWMINGAKRQLVYISHVGPDRITFDDVDGNEFFVNISPKTGVDFEFLPVDRGFYPSNNGRVFYIERVPARQWHRGISAHNTAAWEVGDDWFGSRINGTLLKQIFIEKGEYQYKPGANCALSKYFFVSKKGIVRFFTQPIGKVVDRRVVMDNEIVTQELRDCIRRNHYDLEI